MPTIIVTSDSTENGAATVTMREHVVPASLDSEHYSDQLIQRVGWAVVDAEERLGRVPALQAADPNCPYVPAVSAADDGSTPCNP